MAMASRRPNGRAPPAGSGTRSYPAPTRVAVGSAAAVLASCAQEASPIRWASTAATSTTRRACEMAPRSSTSSRSSATVARAASTSSRRSSANGA